MPVDSQGLFNQLIEQYKAQSQESPEEAEARATLARLKADLYKDDQSLAPLTNKQQIFQGLMTLAPMLAAGAYGARAGAAPGIEGSRQLQSQFADQELMRQKRLREKNLSGIEGATSTLANLKAQKAAGLQSTQAQFNAVSQMERAQELARHHRATEFGSSQGKSDTAQRKADEYIDKRLKQMNDDMNPDKGRAGNKAKLKMQVNQAEALEALAVNNGKIAALNPQQQVEAARMLDSILAQGGQATVSITNELVPKTVGRSSADILQWITNSPQDARAQKFTKYILDTARREGQVRRNQLRKAQASSLPQYKDIKEKDPVRYEEQLRALGFEPTDFDEKGQYVEKNPIDTTLDEDKKASKPLSVIQNGHTYHLNPATGEYE